jgi:hypothetical protein
MIAEPYGLDWLAAACQTLLFVSLVYFFYLVLKFGHMLHHTASEGDARSLHQVSRDAYLTMWQGEPEHGAAGRKPGGAGARVAHGSR